MGQGEMGNSLRGNFARGNSQQGNGSGPSEANGELMKTKIILMKLYYILFMISFLLMNLSVKAQESKLVQLSKNKFQYDDHVGGLHSFKYVFMKDSAYLMHDFRSFNANRRAENAINGLGIAIASISTAFGISVYDNDKNTGEDEIIGGSMIFLGAGLYGLSRLISWPVRIEKNKHKKALLSKANIEFIKEEERLRQDVLTIDHDAQVNNNPPPIKEIDKASQVNDTLSTFKKTDPASSLIDTLSTKKEGNPTEDNPDLNIAKGGSLIRISGDSYKYGDQIGELHEFEQYFVQQSEEQAKAFHEYDKYRRLQSNTMTIGLFSGGLTSAYGALLTRNSEKARLGRTLLFSGLGVISVGYLISGSHKDNKLRYKDGLLSNTKVKQAELGKIEIKPTENGLGVVYTF